MAFNEISDHLYEAKNKAADFGKSSVEYYKLRVMKSSARGAITLVRFSIFGVIGTLALLFLSIATAIWLGEVMDSAFLGYLMVGAFYILLLIIILTTSRRLIQRKVLAAFSSLFYDDSEGTKTSRTTSVAKNLAGQNKIIEP